MSVWDLHGWLKQAQKNSPPILLEAGASVATTWLPNLEPERRADCNAQVVMRSVCKINFVTDIYAQADWSPKGFGAYAGVEGCIKVTCPQVPEYVTDGTKGGGRVAEHEIVEAALRRYEDR